MRMVVWLLPGVDEVDLQEEGVGAAHIQMLDMHLCQGVGMRWMASPLGCGELRQEMIVYNHATNHVVCGDDVQS